MAKALCLTVRGKEQDFDVVRTFKVGRGEKPLVVYYCKANKDNGLTVRIVQGSKILLDCSGIKSINEGLKDFELIDGNSQGIPRSSNARCVLTIYDGSFVALLAKEVVQ